MRRRSRVVIQQLDSTAQELADLNVNFAQKVQELESTEAALQGMWEGEAREAFHTAFTSDIGQMMQFKALVDTYAAKLQDIRGRYALAEEQSAEIARNRTYR